MIEETIRSIIEAESQAARIEEEGMHKARKIAVEAQNRADELRETTEREVKDEIKQLMLAARDEGERQAAARVLHGLEEKKDRAADKQMEKAVQYILKEFHARL